MQHNGGGGLVENILNVSDNHQWWVEISGECEVGVPAPCTFRTENERLWAEQDCSKGKSLYNYY